MSEGYAQQVKPGSLFRRDDDRRSKLIMALFVTTVRPYDDRFQENYMIANTIFVVDANGSFLFLDPSEKVYFV